MAAKIGIGALPLELFDQILAYLYYEDIVTISSTCKEIRALTLPLVYQTIRLQPRGSVSHPGTDRAGHFYKLFRVRPHLADYVRHVELSHIDPKVMEHYAHMMNNYDVDEHWGTTPSITICRISGIWVNDNRQVSRLWRFPQQRQDFGIQS